MTAGRGIAHAEESLAGRDVRQHGAQLWVALPASTRHGEPAFEHHAEMPQVALGGVEATILVGALDGQESPARRDTPLLGAALTAVDDRESVIPLVASFEYGVVVLDGELHVGAASVRPGELVYLGPGRDELPVTATPGCHALLLGGAPFETPILMWWNFVARTRDEVRAAASAWNDERQPFAPVASSLPRIPAPAPM